MLVKAYITYRIIMPFRKSYHMPCRKLFPPFTLTSPKWTKIKSKNRTGKSVKNCGFSLLNMKISCRHRRIGWLSSLITTCGIHVVNVLPPKGLLTMKPTIRDWLLTRCYTQLVNGRYQYFSSRIVWYFFVYPQQLLCYFLTMPVNTTKTKKLMMRFKVRRRH